MSLYTVELDCRVKKDLKSLWHQEIKKIKKAIAGLKINPRPDGCKKIKGKQHNYYLIRVGNYRIIYAVEDLVLLVLGVRIGHRREVDRKL